MSWVLPLSNRRLRAGLLLAFLLLPAVSEPARAWGTMAHGLYTRAAIDRLSGPLGAFFRANRDFLTCYSVLPDDWWGSPALVPKLPPGLEMPAGKPGMGEVERHFFEIDDPAYVEARGARNAADQRPVDRAAALAIFQRYVKRHGSRALAEFQTQNPAYTGGLVGLAQAKMEAAGQVVWTISERLADLVNAMKSGRWTRALFLATVLGHYVGDAHVPLHTTMNYDGALSKNKRVKGVHARWEARMLERNEADVKAYLAARLQARRPGPLQAAAVPRFLFSVVAQSHALVPEILATDAWLLRDRPGKTDSRPKSGASTASGPYTDAYFGKLYDRLGTDAKRRLWRSVEDTALLWDLAWRLAGRPMPPAGKIETPETILIDFKHNRFVPYDPALGPRE